MPTLIIFLLLCSTANAQTGWEVVKAVPLGTTLRVNSSITGRLDAVDDKQITLNGRRIIQDVVSRVERVGVGGQRKRNVGIAILAGFGVGAAAAKANGSAAWHAAYVGSLYGGVAGLVAAAMTKPSNVVIYQR